MFKYNTKSISTTICTYCKNRGKTYHHRIETCSRLKNTICKNCGKKGHTKKSCNEPEVPKMNEETAKKLAIDYEKKQEEQEWREEINNSTTILDEFISNNRVVNSSNNPRQSDMTNQDFVLKIKFDNNEVSFSSLPSNLKKSDIYLDGNVIKNSQLWNNLVTKFNKNIIKAKIVHNMHKHI